jgi:hypothetical protein
VIHLFVLAFAGGEQAVAAAPQGFDQGRRRLFQHLVQGVAFQLAAFRQQLARGQVGVGDGARRIGQVRHQQHGHRRVLHHGVEQQLALHEVEALFAQHLAEGVVGVDQVGQLVVLAPVQAEGKVAVAVARHRALQGAEQRQDRLDLRADGDQGDRHHAQQADREHGQRLAGQQVIEGQRDQDPDRQQRADQGRPARHQREPEALAGLAHIVLTHGARDAQALHAAVQGLARQPEVGRGLGDDAARARQRLHDGLAVRLRIGAAAGAPGRGQRQA